MASAANSNGSAPGRPFKPGESGNPSGRPKGIARQLRDAIKDDPTVITQVFLEILRDPKAKHADKIAAGREYLDRCYGKAPSYAPVEGDPLELAGVDRAIGELVDELAARRETAVGGQASDGAVADTG